MVKTLDDNNGIAKGDIVLSLLNANLSEANRAPKGGDQVRDAILRMRDMRRRQEKVEMPEYEPDESGGTELDSPSKRSVLPVDVDDMRVVGAFDHVKTLEEDAIEHLKVRIWTKQSAILIVIRVRFSCHFLYRSMMRLKLR